MKEAYAWIAFGVFGLTMIGSVASYLWSEDYLWWPLLFAAISLAFMGPPILVPMFCAVFATLESDAEPAESD